jgi:hypothetical protein
VGGISRGLHLLHCKPRTSKGRKRQVESSIVITRVHDYDEEQGKGDETGEEQMTLNRLVCLVTWQIIVRGDESAEETVPHLFVFCVVRPWLDNRKPVSRCCVRTERGMPKRSVLQRTGLVRRVCLLCSTVARLVRLIQSEPETICDKASHLYQSPQQQAVIKAIPIPLHSDGENNRKNKVFETKLF